MKFQDEAALPKLVKSLYNLKELSIENLSPLRPLVLSTAAELTRLEVKGYVVSYRLICTSSKLKRQQLVDEAG